MEELRELFEAAKNPEKKKDVFEAINFLANKNIEEAFPALKTIFFHPLTVREIRMEVGRLLASTKSKPLYNLLISHLILKNFLDIPTVIYTLGEYKEDKICDLLLKEYDTSAFEAKLEIITALGKMKSTKALEFFSKVYNEESKSANFTTDQIQKLKERAGEALQNQVVDL